MKLDVAFGEMGKTQSALPHNIMTWAQCYHTVQFALKLHFRIDHDMRTGSVIIQV